MSDQYKIKETWMGVWVHQGPGINYPRQNVLYGNDSITYNVTNRQNQHWIYITTSSTDEVINGWCCDIDSDGTVVMVKVENEENTVTDVKPEASTSSSSSSSSSSSKSNEESYAYVPSSDVIVSTADQLTNDLENNLTISNLRGIFGMPYQFMSSADPRISDATTDSIGRKFAKEIISQMPLLLITPGVPIFMSNFNTNDKRDVLKKFINLASGNEDDIKTKVLDTKVFGKYYSLKYAYKEYFDYVNPMCRIAARLMNLQDETIGGVKLESLNWAKNTNEGFSKIFSVYRGCTAWYCESENNISESFSNDITESALASKLNSLSDYGRELNFLLGTVHSRTNPGTLLDKFTDPENLTRSMENVSNFINTALGNTGVSGIFSTITNSAQTIAAGGKLVFPKIWSESSFNRSYNVNLKLVSPDGDDLSIYLNIIVPMLHLLGLVLPREAEKSHGYMSPFLVRGFYKGFFNVDMGIITDLSFSKGKDSAWTINGLPTTVDVSFTITDLYSDMYISSMTSTKNNTLNNIILMDYISNLCGININEVDVLRSIDLFWIQNGKNRITDTWHMKILQNVDQFITNKWQNLLGRF